MAGDVPTDDLRGALEAALNSRFGPVVRLRRTASAYGSSFTLEEVRVEFAGGTCLDVMFKDLSPGGLTPLARAAKPTFLYDPGREIAVYRDLLAHAGLGTAECYGTAVDPGAARYWLFLERVRGRELYQVGESATWRAAARWLAGLHTRFALRAGALRSVGLVLYDAEYYRRWPERAVAFAAPAVRPRLERLAAGYGRVVERLLTLPVTLLHGEYFASNVIVRDDGAICPVDWETAAVGPGLIDLAALTAGRWTDGERTALALAYHRALPSWAGRDEFLIALDLCRLHLALQWLGWAANWTPPAEHAHDWLGEALTLAAKLGLD